MFLLRFYRLLEFDIILNVPLVELTTLLWPHMASFRYIRDNESIKTE